MLPIVYSHDEQGAPTLNNAPGSLISVLKACLVTGFNNVGISSVSISGNVATVVTNANHGLVVGRRVTVEGVSVTAANGAKTVSTVPSATSFTFPCTNADASESPVSASVKRTPLGWVEQFSKPNVSMFKSSDLTSYGQSLRIDDSAGFDVRSFGVINPTSVDDYGARFPRTTQVTAGDSYWTKGMGNSAAKKWWVVGDEKMFYYICEGSAYYNQHTETSYAYMVGCFGDIISYKNGEAFGTVWCGSPGATNSYPESAMLRHYALGTAPGKDGVSYLARSHDALEDSVAAAFCHPGGDSPGYTGVQFPSPVDNGLVLASPTFVSERKPAQHPVRGVMPGLLTPLGNYAQFPNTSQKPWAINTTDGTGVKALLWSYCLVQSSPSYTLALDVSRSWR